MTQTSSTSRPAATLGKNAGDAAQGDLLSGDFMHKLDTLDVLSRKVLRGRMQGERRSKKRGQSVEFADYRNYVVGDDLRRIDWNLYARLDRLFLRLFLEEEDLSVTIALDTTASMNHGQPNKLAYAKRIAAALGYVGLSHMNRVSLYSFTHYVREQLVQIRGRRPIPQMLRFLDRQQPPDDGVAQRGNLNEVCKRLRMLSRQPGIIVLISDFFDKGELADALRYLVDGKYDVYAIQILSPQEVEPSKGEIVGDLSLEDIEDRDITEISISPALVKRYKSNLQAYCHHVRDTCMRRGISYMATETDVPFEQVILRYLRERGLLG